MANNNQVGYQQGNGNLNNGMMSYAGNGRDGMVQQPGQFSFNPNVNGFLTNPTYDNGYMGNNRMGQQNLLNNQFLKCRPVSSKEEALAAQIDLDGSLWVFTDIGNGKIYTKQINRNGTADFGTYTFTQEEDPYTSAQNVFVTKEEFNKVIQALSAAIQPQQAQSQVQMQPTQVPQQNPDSKTELVNF